MKLIELYKNFCNDEVLVNNCEIYTDIHVHISDHRQPRIYIHTSCVAQLANASDTRASSGPLINFIIWVLKYYLEVILYNCI